MENKNTLSEIDAEMTGHLRAPGNLNDEVNTPSEPSSPHASTSEEDPAFELEVLKFVSMDIPTKEELQTHDIADHNDMDFDDISSFFGLQIGSKQEEWMKNYKEFIEKTDKLLEEIRTLQASLQEVQASVLLFQSILAMSENLKKTKPLLNSVCSTFANSVNMTYSGDQEKRITIYRDLEKKLNEYEELKKNFVTQGHIGFIPETIR